MRKLTKFLAVALTVVLLCGMIATMVSAEEAEINYPEYAAPSAASVMASYSSNFEEGSKDPGSFGTSNGFILNKITAGGNTYAQITNINADGTLATHKARSMGNMFSPYMVMGNYDYITVDFDIIADKYTNGTDIKTIEEYNALDDKTGYYPTYATTRFTLEAMGVVGYGDAAFLWIKQDATTKDWFLCTSNGASRYYLPTEAGVWTHVTYAIKYDVNVTYTDDNGTNTVSYREFSNLNGSFTDVSVIVNSTLDIYANGEFAFNIPSATKTNAAFTADSFKAGGNTFKYNQLQYGTSGSSVATTPISFGLDNITLAGYVDGYVGDLADAINNNTSLLNTEDAIFNQNYNETKSVAATITKADGTVYGYMTVEQAFSAAESGDTVEILVDNNATLNLTNEATINNLTVKSNGKEFNYVLPDVAPYVCNEENGVYTFTLDMFAEPEYVGAVNATVIYNSGYTSFKSMNGLTSSIVNDSYFNITNWVDGAIVENTASRQYGTVAAPYLSIVDGDYVTISFDVMADKYTNGTSLISIEDYNNLSDEDKAGYTPSYTQTHYYMEMPCIANGYSSLWIKNFGGKWYLTTVSGNATKDSWLLPETAGVWSNITLAIKTDVNVTYTENEETKTVTYAEYKALKAPASDTATVTLSSDFVIYVDGEYAFDYSALDRNNSTFAYSSFSGQNITFKYMQLQAGNDSTSRVKTAMSMCYDNFTMVRYEDGYNGDFATAFENRDNLFNSKDSLYNSTYNKTDSDFVIAVKNPEDAYGYKFYTVGAAMNYIKDGATVELYADATLDIDGFASVIVITNGNEFNYTAANLNNYEVKETDVAGTYIIKIKDYVEVEYVGPVGPTKYGSYYDFDTTSDAFNAASDKNEITVAKKEMYGNNYMSYTFTNGTSSSGETIRFGSWYNTPILKYDYITLDLDIVADGYRNKTDASIITIEAYEALSDADKANYEAAYTIGQFYHEYNVISLYDYFQMLLIKKVDGKYALTNSEGTFAYFLPEKAGVWTHITWVTTIGNTVTYYTDDTKTTTATMSYKEYAASGKGEADYASVNLSESTQSIFVNGEYLGDLAKWSLNESINLTAYANLAKVYYKYLFFKGANNSNTSKFSENFSMGFDNNFMHVYNEGYNGDIVNAKVNGIHNATDTVYNSAYNKTNSPAAIAVSNIGDVAGKIFYNVESAMAYANDGATIYFLGKLNKSFVIDEASGFTTLNVVAVDGAKIDFAVSSDIAISYVKDGDKYVLSFGESVVIVDGIGYASFEEAYAAMKNGSTIELLADATLPFTVSANTSLRNFTVKTSGFSFEYEISEDVVSYVSENNGEYVFSVMPKNLVVAMVTTIDGVSSFYATFEEALAALTDAATLELYANLSENIVISAGSDIEKLTVKTNGYTFGYEIPANYQVLEIEPGVFVISVYEVTLVEYVGPVGPSLLKSYDYESEKSKFNATTDKQLITVEEKVYNGNTYPSYTYTDYPGEPVQDMIRWGNFYSYHILNYDYLTIDIDIMADMYRSLEDASLISIEDYEKLSADDKANYEPAYHQGQFYHEFTVISYPDYGRMLKITKAGTDWILSDNNSTFSYVLPDEAGVWTHITWVVSIGNTVTYYTDDTKTETATMSFKDYYASKLGDEYFKSINISESTMSIYANGNYIGDIPGWADKNYDTATIETLANTTYKYMFFKGAPSSSTSKFSNNFSMGADNNVVYAYAEGYNGAFAEAVDARESILNCGDAFFNSTYNKTNTYTAIVSGENTSGYIGYYSHETAYASLENGSMVTLLKGTSAELDPGCDYVYVNTNGYNCPVAAGYGLFDLGNGYYKCEKVSSGYTADGIYYEDATDALAALKDDSVLRLYAPIEGAIHTDKAITVYTNGYDVDITYIPSTTYYAALELIDANGTTVIEKTFKNTYDISVFFANIKDGETIKLLSNVVTNRSNVFSNAGEYTVDFNGYDYVTTSPESATRSFIIYGGVTLNVTSSREGTEIYNYTATGASDAIFSAHQSANGNTEANINVDGKNIKTFSSRFIQNSSNSTGTINVDGGSYYSTSSGYGLFYILSGNTYNITNANLIATGGNAFYIDSFATEVNVSNCTVYASNVILGGVMRDTLSLEFEDCIIAGDIGNFLNPKAIFGNGCKIANYVRLADNIADGAVIAKTNEHVGFSILTNALQFTEDGALISDSIGYTSRGYSAQIDSVILTDGYYTVTWKNADESISEIWAKGVAPVCPFEIPAGNDFYSYAATVTADDGNGNVVYEILPKANFDILMNLTLYTDFIYNIYVPKSVVDAGYVSTINVNGSAAEFANKTVSIGGVSYYVIEIAIVPSLADAQQTVALDIVAPDGLVFTQTLKLSIPAYAETILAGNYSDATVDLMNATLAYVKAAGDYFGTGTGVIGSVTNAPAVDGVPFITPSSSVLAVIKGATLSLDSTFKITFFFTDDASGEVTFTYPVKGTMTDHTVTATPGGSYQVSLRARDLLTYVTVKVGESTMKYGVENYIYYVNSDAFKNSNSISADQYEALKTLVYNLYAYANASKNYVSENTLADVVINGNYLDSYVIVATNVTERNMAAYIQNAIYKSTGIRLPVVSSSNGPAFRFEKLALPTFYDGVAYVSESDVIVGSYLDSFADENAMRFALECLANLNGTVIWNDGDYVAGYLADTIYYSDFGAIGDGKTNDSIALHKAHNYANERGYLVKATEGATYYIDKLLTKEGSNSQSSIYVSTNVDWTGAKFIIDDRNLRNPDPELVVGGGAIFMLSPVESAITISNTEVIESYFPGLTIDKATITKLENWNYGFPTLVFVTNANHKNYDRLQADGATGGGAQVEIILVDEFGNISEDTPFMFDYDDITSIRVIRVDDAPITLKGGEFTSYECLTPADEEVFYASRGINIQRSNVTLDGVKHYLVDERTGSSDYKMASSGFFHTENVNNILFVDCVATGHLKAAAGSYDISLASSNNVVLKNVTQSNYFQDEAQTIPGVRNNVQWGVMGSNYCKNVTYDSCLLTRFDAHCGLYNGKIINSRVSSLELIGAGDFLIENTIIDPYQTSNVILLRPDYGCTWNGTITLRNVTVNNTNTTMNILSATCAEHDFGYTRYIPNVVIDGITFTNKLDYAYMVSTGLTKDNNPATSTYPMVAPSKFTVLNSPYTFYVHNSPFFVNTVLTGVSFK